ncbi:MAG: hypothetical protein AB4911_02375 [Oscillochloridaceae bacterium umkhey_bin13]
MRAAAFFMSMLVGIALLLTTFPVPVSAQTTAAPRLIFQTNIPGLRINKFPDIATYNRDVHIVANNNERDAIYIFKRDTDQNFPPPLRLGDAFGQADYSPVTVAAGLDGTVHIAWINGPERRIYHRQRPLGGEFGPLNVVANPRIFPANINMEIASDGVIFVSWREVNEPMRVTYSSNNGLSWAGQISLGPSYGLGFPMMARGPNGTMVAAYTSPIGDLLQIFIAIWDGSSFRVEQISPMNDNYADPTAAFDPDGNVYVNYRGIQGARTTGVWLATRVPGGWQRDLLTDRVNVGNLVNLQIDREATMHLTWVAEGGGNQVFYAYRPRGGTFSVPLAAPNSTGGAIFNPRMDITLSDDEVFVHVVTELFVGDTNTVRYHLFGSPSVSPPAPIPVIRDGATFSPSQTTIPVRFDNISAPPPPQIRYRWNAPPDDANNDSGGWIAFANPMDVAVPDRILSSASCTPSRLFIQVRRDSGATSKVTDDTITFDGEVNANMIFGNPFNARRARLFTPFDLGSELGMTASMGDSGLGGASDGHMGYTRVPAYYLEVSNANDCSGLREFAAGRSTTSFGPAVSLDGRSFANILPYPGVMVAGPNQMVVRVADQINNQMQENQTLIYDPAKPVLTASTPQSLSAPLADPQATIVRQLVVREVTVVDNLYPGRGFWGVWVANSRTPIADPVSDPNLRWFPAQAPGTSSDVTLPWSLAAGLERSQMTTGDYYIYVRFLDGAGNATDSFLTTRVTLDAVSFPRVNLPLTRR